MNTLEMLRAANPGLKIYSVLDKEFAPYGRILDWADTAELSRVFADTPIPEAGNSYTRSDKELEKLAIMNELKLAAFGDMPIEAGYCNGNGFTLNAMEYHRCSEINFTTTGLVLLLALPGDVKNNKLDSADVVGFYLPPEILVEIHPLVLHFAPCRINEGGFRCLVVLEDGTNEALDAVDTSAPGERCLLWMRNKWMLCHPASPQAEKGAYQGICGENIQLHI